MTQQGTAEIVISLARDERTGFPALVVSALEPSGRTRHYAGSLADDIRQILAPAAPVAPPGKKKAPQPEPGGAAGEPPEA